MTTTTFPFAEDTPDLLDRTLTHTAAVRVSLPSGEVIPLDLEGGRLSYDETRSPRVEAVVDVTVPTDAALLGRIDARTGARLEVDCGYVRPGGVQDVHNLAYLGLRSRKVPRPGDVMQLVGRSDEALVIDSGPDVGAAVTGSSVVDAMDKLIWQIDPLANISVTSSPGPAVAAEVYEDRWDYLAALADRIGAQVYHDGKAIWNIAPVPVITAPAYALSVGDGGTITESDAGLGRDGDSESSAWANVVYLVHEWVDGSNVPRKIVSKRRIQSGPYAAVQGNTKVLEIKRSSSISQANADAAAAALVARTVTRGRTFTVTAPSAYWLRPGHTITVTLPTGPTESHLVVSVEFDLKSGLMNITTRLPDNTGTIGA